jgi:hypothetical protein
MGTDIEKIRRASIPLRGDAPKLVAKGGCWSREKITRKQQMSTTTARIPQAMKHKLLGKKLGSQLYHPKKGQGLLFKHAAVIFRKKLVSKFKVTMLQDVLYSVREIKFLQEIQPGITIFQKLTLMKSTKKPTEGKIFYCTILVIMTHWCVDGTFKVAPQFFTQVYTVHALVNNRALPMIYVLLNNKQQATYKRVFEKLMEIEPTLRPESIVSDFEISAINAINEVFPNAQITGCMFHLAQNLWKKIQKTHLVE